MSLSWFSIDWQSRSNRIWAGLAEEQFINHFLRFSFFEVRGSNGDSIPKQDASYVVDKANQLTSAGWGYFDEQLIERCLRLAEVGYFASGELSLSIDLGKPRRPRNSLLNAKRLFLRWKQRTISKTFDSEHIRTSRLKRLFSFELIISWEAITAISIKHFVRGSSSSSKAENHSWSAISYMLSRFLSSVAIDCVRLA